MRDYDESFVDAFLEKLNTDITWKVNRQQQIRQRFLSKLNDEVTNKKSLLSGWKNKALPLLATALFIGVLTTVLLSEFSGEKPMTQTQEETGQLGTVNGENNSSGFSIDIDDEHEYEIEQIKESGFDLKLPEYSPVEQTIISNIKNRSHIGNVYVSFYDQESEELFQIMQESMEGVAPNIIKERLAELKETNVDIISINGMESYYKEMEIDNGIIRKSILLLLGEYGYSIYSEKLTKEQLIAILESVDFKN